MAVGVVALAVRIFRNHDAVAQACGDILRFDRTTDALLTGCCRGCRSLPSCRIPL